MQEYEQSVFISYAWGGESEDIVNQIDQALQQRGLKMIRDKRDLGYKGSINEFMERIGQGNCVIVVISDKYLRSPNCMFELVEIAEGKQFHDRVFPIVLSNAEIYDPVKRLEYVKHWELKRGELAQAMKEVDPANLQGIREDMDLYDRIRDKVSGLTSILKDMNTLTPEMHKDSDFSEIYAGIERRMAAVSGLLKPEAGKSPYMGMRYFDTSDADLFYGREILTHELLARIQKESFLAIVGASGSGKSSVARAGLIPAWKKENTARGRVYIITPTKHPLESLAASLTRDSESVTATSTLVDDMQKDARSLRLYLRKRWSNSRETNLLLVVDQFEETFTLCKDTAERKAFIENLLSLADEENDTVHVVFTLRADFYHYCAEYESLRLALEKHQAYIGAMTQDELREAITFPAEKNGWDFQPGLVDLILQDVGTEPGALPLLSHALLETWKGRQGRTLTLRGYHEAGGVKKAIAKTAENVYGHLSPEEKTIARNIFLRLTELGEGTQDTRRRLKMDELAQAKEQEAIAKVLKTLTDARLVTTEQDSAEVAHEALIREWGTLRKWLDEDREELRLHRHLTESAQEWEKSGRNELYLIHRGGRLDDALLLKEKLYLGFSTIEEEYLEACAELRNREQRERDKRLRLTVMAFVIASVIFLALAGFGLFKSNQAEKQARIILARQLASQAQLINPATNSKQMVPILLAVQSMRWFPNLDAASFLINSSYPAFQISSMRHNGSVLSIAFSPDGKYVASGGGGGGLFSAGVDSTARVWEAMTGKEVARMTHGGPVYAVVFSPDGKYVVSGSGDYSARVWEAMTGKEVTRMTHDDPVYAVAFSPDGKYVVSGSGDHTARVWQAITGKEVTRMTHGDKVTSVAFSPDGKYVVSGGGDGTARVWEAMTGKEVAHMTHDGDVNEVAFSPDGKYVVSGSGDYSVRVWQAMTGKEVARMTHDGSVNKVAFSPDGKYVISGSGDHSARVWQAMTGKEVTRMTHNFNVYAVAFSPDGKYVISGGDDGTARVWEAMTGKEVTRMTHDSVVRTVAFSPDGKYVASGGGSSLIDSDNTARIWEAVGSVRIVREIQDGSVHAVAFSRDGKYVVSGGGDNARVWEAMTGKEVARMTHDGEVNAVAFSPDGKYVVSGGWDNTARVWEAMTGKEVARMTYGEKVTCVAFSPDGKYVVSGGGNYGSKPDNTARVWEALTGKEVARMTHDDPVYAVAFSPDGKYVISGGGDNARVWEAMTGKEVARMTHGGSVNEVAFSPDGKYVVSGGGEGTARVWEAMTGKEIARTTHDGPLSFVAFSPDGKYVVSGGWDNTARVWEAVTGKEIAHVTHDGDVNAVAFSPDGKYVISGGGNYAMNFDFTARVWEAMTGKEIARTTHDGPVLSVAFSPDGRYVASASGDRTVRVWEWQTGDIIGNACKIMPRNLTLAEWRQFVGIEIPYSLTCDPRTYPNAIIPEDVQEYLKARK